MAIRSDLITQYARLPAFRGFVSADIEVYLDIALQAVEGYAPKKVKMKQIPVESDARYTVPENAQTVLGAFVTDTNIRIEMREERDAQTGTRTYLLLQVQVPSWIGLVRDDGLSGYQSYPTPYASGYRYSTFAGAGYETHDLEYTVPLEVADLTSRQLVALRLYAEGEAYQLQATKSSSLSDITDREASGASTTLRRSQSGNAFQKLAMQRQKDFVREVARPYWSVDSYGLTEFLWSERRL